MCCFSGMVRIVTGTRIFARHIQPGVQAIAYSMRFAADDEVAMILPLPVVPGAGERGATFVDLKGYPDLFSALNDPFREKVVMRSAPNQRGNLGAPQTLEVHTVGDFVASWVPTLKDFDRVDPQFRIAPEVWASLPDYRNYGFAVFQLALRGIGGTTQEVHPMALTFLTRWKDRLFFPTVHIHDGVVHPRETFDHELFAQGALKTSLIARPRWKTSAQTAGSFVKTDRTQGLIDPATPVHKLTLRGELPNRDTLTYLR